MAAGDNKITLIVLGDYSSGKESLIRMYDDGGRGDFQMKTLGLDYISKLFTPPGSSTELKVKVFGTAGQERFRTLTHAFYKQAQGVVIVFDITNEESFRNVRKWMETIE